MPETEPAHLWEFDHPYYSSESNYYSNDCSHHSDSWAEFMEEMGDADKDHNLLFRWDWERPDPADYEPGEDPGYTDRLHLFYVLQRKGIYMTWEVDVTPDDETAVRWFLNGYWQHMQLLWSPFQAAYPEDEEG